MARPTKYTEALANQILDKISTTSKSLGEICKGLKPKKIATSSVYLWLQQNTSFSERYARAREAQAHLLADEIIDIADKSRIGTKKSVKDTDEGQEVTVVTADMVERSRLMIDARKWKASKLAPKVYGDRTQVELSGEIKTNNAEQLTDEQLAAIAAGSSQTAPEKKKSKK